MLKKFWHQQSLRYLLVGGFNTFISYCIYSYLIYRQLNYILAVIISTGLGVIISFNTHGRLVFGNFHRKNFLKYFSMVLVLFFVNIGLIHGFYSLGMNYYFSGFLSTGSIAFMTYFLNKHWIFVKRNQF